MHPSSFLFFIGLVLLCLGIAILGIAGNIFRKLPVQTGTGFPPQIKQELAQSHFRLGVATCHLLITRHELAGEPVPDGTALYRECVAHDIKVSGGESLLKVPEDGK